MVDRDLAADVHDAQEHLLRSANTISTDEVILLVEEIRGEPISGQERPQVAQLLSKHPDLVAAALGSGLWKRGINPGPPKRHFIGQGR